MARLLGWCLVAAAGAFAFWFWAQRSVYFPSRYPQGYWELRERVGAADVWIATRDGVRLHGWWIAVPGARVATLHLHGNGGNITHREGHIRGLRAAGTSLLLVDYRGYGKSGGWPTEKGLYADADAGYDYLVQQGFAPNRIVVYGESLGTSVAVDLAARRPVAGVVLEAPFTSASDVAARVLPGLGPLVMRSYDTRSKIGRVRAPIFILQGDRDEVIPFELGQALFAAAPEPKQFWRVAGAHHSDIPEFAVAEYAARMREFFAGLK
ncbi:MAG: alpha/beta hydrolase [Acidobacteria bacterium]|nr:alpha/beta hydrolase [Acidobacteriota bacterium]